MSARKQERGHCPGSRSTSCTWALVTGGPVSHLWEYETEGHKNMVLVQWAHSEYNGNFNEYLFSILCTIKSSIVLLFIFYGRAEHAKYVDMTCVV